MFTLHTTPLSSLIHSHKLDHHLYAGDSQVYISLSTADTELSLKQLGTSRQRRILTHFFPTSILNYSITPSDTKRNFDVTFDSDFNFRKTDFSDMSLLLLSYSWPMPYSVLYFSFSRWNHCYSTHYYSCNSPFYNIAFKDILKLQCVQNYLVWVVTLSPWFSHSVSLLKSVHWPPVQSRIIFKLSTVAYQTLSSGEPSYLFSMLSLSPKPRELNSSGFHLLSVPRVKNSCWDSSFFSCCPYSLEFTLWTC